MTLVEVLIGVALVAIILALVAPSLRDLLAAQPTGTRLSLRLSRGGQPLELGVDLGQRPARRC
jgi:Tfp pilus assembly protein FimT